MGQALAREQFGQGKGVKAHGEMGEAVEVVAREAEQVGHEAEGHVGEGVVAADGVQKQPDGHHGVGQVGVAEAVVRGREQCEDGHDRYGFRPPHRARGGVHGQGREKDGENAAQDQGKKTFAHVAV